MMKLLKYDWKRSSDGILSTFAILIIVQVVLTIVGKMNNWVDALILGLSAFFYMLTGALLFINCCKSFDHNIKSYSRRLLTLHPMNGIGAVILLSWIILVAITAIATIHFWIYTGYTNWDFSLLKESELWSIRSIAIMLLQGLWMYTFLLVSIMFSITVARSFRVRRSTWIGVLFFILLYTVYFYIDHLLFNGSSASAGNVSFEVTENTNGISFLSSQGVNFLIGPFLLEAVIVAGSLYLMSYLLNKKVEI